MNNISIIKLSIFHKIVYTTTVLQFTVIKFLPLIQDLIKKCDNGMFDTICTVCSYLFIYFVTCSIIKTGKKEKQPAKFS